MAEQTADQILRGAGAGAVTFGILALAAPRAFATIYGLPHEAHLRTMTRLWGTRTAAIGAMALGVGRPEDRRSIMMLALGMNALDAAVVAGAGSRVSLRSRALGALSSGAFAAALGYGLAEG